MPNPVNIIKYIIHIRIALRWSILLCFICFGDNPVYSQPKIILHLQKNIQQAVTDSERIVRLEQLSEYYYANKDFSRGDSLINQQITLANASAKQNLLLMAYFHNTGYLSTNATTKDRLENTSTYILRALEYAKKNNLQDYIAFAYASLAALNITEGQQNIAIQNAEYAYNTALQTTNDSAKVVTAIQLGNTYIHRSELLKALKLFSSTKTSVLTRYKESLLPLVDFALANFYKKLGKTDTSRQYIAQSLSINTKLNNIKGQITDHIFWAKISNYAEGKQHLEQAVNLATSIEDVPLKIEAKRILFFHMILQEKPEFLLSFLENNEELKNLFFNSGPSYLDWIKAEIYFYSGEPVKAIEYFKKAEPDIKQGYDNTTKKNFFNEYAACIESVNEVPVAIKYYEKSLELARATSDLGSLKSVTAKLKNLYASQQNYREAFKYGMLNDQYKDSVELMGKDKDLAMLEVDNEEKEQIRLEKLAAEQLQRKYNLQYMFITIVIATAFVLLIMIGMFKVSAFTIRLMGFFSLIFLFEFIILILDSWIHHQTHGEPWKVWLIKIGIISLLLPLHHFLEHKLIHYLLSRHLIIVRSKLSVKKWFAGKKKPLPESNPEGEANEIIEKKSVSD